MDSEPNQPSTPSALDKVVAALAALGPDTAAAIAQRAGVGYSTATNRLRVLEEAGQAEAFRADDGRTLWRQPANAADSGDSVHPPATTTAADPPHRPGPDSTDECPAPEDSSTAVAAGRADEPPGDPADGGLPPTPQVGTDQPSPQDVRRLLDDSRSELAATDGDDVTPGHAEDAVAAETGGEAESGQDAGAAGGDDSIAASGPAEAASALTGGKPRRSKGTLRGAIRDVLEAHPGQPLRTSQLCRAIDTANEGSGSAKASAGAVVNAVHKLVADGIAVQVTEKPAAFQLAAKTDS